MVESHSDSTISTSPAKRKAESPRLLATRSSSTSLMRRSRAVSSRHGCVGPGRTLIGHVKGPPLARHHPVLPAPSGATSSPCIGETSAQPLAAQPLLAALPYASQVPSWL